MTDIDISNLEAAARVFMNPGIVSPLDRQNAEQVIISFRKTPSPYIICRHILEKSAVDMLLFEAADVIKKALIFEWDSLQEQDRMDIRQYLLNYVLQRELQPYVREKILQAIAIIIKRKSVTDAGQETRFILDEMAKLLSTAPAEQKLLVCRVLAAILQEYLITVKSDDKGLTFGDHFKVKKTFEMNNLRKIFEMAFVCLDELMQTLNRENRMLDADAHLLLELLTILEQILMWGYVSPSLPKRLIGLFEGISKTDQTPSLRLNVNWGPVILNPRVIEVFFGVYWKVREIPELQRVTLICLVQLSTLNGAVFTSTHARKEYVTAYMTKFLQFLMSTTVKPCEALSIATTFRKVLLYHINACTTLMPEVQHSMLQQMFQITRMFAEGSAQEQNIGTEEYSYNEALDKILEAWLLILQSKDGFPREMITAYAQEIFLKYMQIHMAGPDGLRTNNDAFDEESDREKYKEQLIIIGHLARENQKFSIELIARCLENRVMTLGTQYKEMFDRNMLHGEMSREMEETTDDIHWLLLIGGHILTLESAGEQPTMPSEIVQYTAEEHLKGNYDLSTSLNVLAAPDQPIGQTEGGETSCDGVIRLVTAVFRLCEMENRVITFNMKDFLSPEVMSNVCWFIKCWSESYLFMDPDLYTNLSPILLSAFGLDTPGGNWILNFILDKVCINVKHFSGEANVIKDTVALFVSIVKRKYKIPSIFSTEHFKRILELKEVAQHNSAMVNGLVLTASIITDKDTQQRYLSEVLMPIREKFNELNWQQAMNPNYGHGRTQISNEVVKLLEDIRVAHDGASASCAQIVYEIFEPILTHLPDLFDMFHNYNYVIVEIFQVLIAVVHKLSFLQAHKVYDICMGCIQNYVKHNANRQRLGTNNNDQNSEDESVEDLMLLMSLLNCLLSKNYFDVNESDDEIQYKERATEVCIVGFQYIIGLITLDMLRYPDLCCKYYQTLTFFVDTKSHKLATLPPTLLTPMLQSVELGLRSFGLEVQAHCLEFVQLVAQTVRTNADNQSFLYNSLLSFVRIIFDLIVNQEISTDNRTECSNAVFHLIYCYPEQYGRVVEHLLEALPNRDHAERLGKEFTTLTEKLNLRGNADRYAQNRFVEHYEKFIVNISFMYD